MFSLIALIIIGDILLVVCLAKIIVRSIINLTNPSIFDFYTTVSSEDQKHRIEKYISILKKNLIKSMNTLQEERYITSSQKDILSTILGQFIYATEDRINNDIGTSCHIGVQYDVAQDIKTGIEMMCGEINRKFYESGCDVRLMSVVDKKGCSYKLYSIKKIETGYQNFPVYKFMDHDKTNTDKNQCFYLINYNDRLHNFLDYEILLMYIDIEKVETTLVDGRSSSYTIINHDPECAVESIINPSVHHIAEYIDSYHKNNETETTMNN